MRLLKTENRKIGVDELNIADSYQRTIWCAVVCVESGRVAIARLNIVFGSR